MSYPVVGFGLRISFMLFVWFVVSRFSGLSAVRSAGLLGRPRFRSGFSVWVFPGALSGGRLVQVQYRLRVPRAGP